jgi:hypothetical protein
MWYGSAKEFLYGVILLKLKDIKKSTVKLQSRQFSIQFAADPNRWTVNQAS